MEVVFEVLKYILPSLVVFFTVYYILKQHFDHEQKKFTAEKNLEISKNSLPLKVQSYERIALMLERIRIVNLAMRLNSKDISVRDLCKTMMMGVQQEFEHNLVQQIYVSEKLWEIILFSKNEVMHHLNELSQKCDNGLAENDARQILYAEISQQTNLIIDKALAAIKKEIQLVI